MDSLEGFKPATLIRPRQIGLWAWFDLLVFVSFLGCAQHSVESVIHHEVLDAFFRSPLQDVCFNLRVVVFERGDEVVGDGFD